MRPDFSGIDYVDAIFLSHGHIDHVGAIDLWENLGKPPVYASAETFSALSVMGLPLPEHARHFLPLTGRAHILDLMSRWGAPAMPSVGNGYILRTMAV